MKRPRTPPSQTWRTFLDNHVPDIIAIDFFVIATVRFRLLYCFLVLRHDRRRVVHFNATAHPAARWTAQQIIGAIPFDNAPRFMIRDRDAIYGVDFCERVKRVGVEEVVTTHCSPWQNPFCERLIGSIRRECLNHLIVLSETHRQRILASYFAYHHEDRTDLSLKRNTPIPRNAEPPDDGRIIALPRVGGLHHRHARAA